MSAPSSSPRDTHPTPPPPRTDGRSAGFSSGKRERREEIIRSINGGLASGSNVGVYKVV